MASAPQEVFGDLATSAFVESSLLFKGLEPEAREDLLRVAQRVRFGAGETISGPSDDGFYLVLEGSAAIVAERGGAPAEIAALGRGAFFGVFRALGGSRPWALVARTDSVVVAIPAPVVGALAARSPRMQKLLETVLAARDREVGER